MWVRKGCRGLLDLRPLKTRPARPSASPQLWQVHLDPRSQPPQQSSRSQKITRAKAPAESRMWLLRAAAGGAEPASWSGAEGASGEARWHHRDVAGPARLREREAVQGYGQRYFRSPHFRLRCSRCWSCRPGGAAAGLSVLGGWSV